MSLPMLAITRITERFHSVAVEPLSISDDL